MFCSFDKLPLILRVYSTANVFHPRDNEWRQCSALFDDFINARNCFELNIDLVQTSCGYAVPYYSFEGERRTLMNSAEKRGEDGIKEYWEQKNQTSLDGKPTYLLED